MAMQAFHALITCALCLTASSLKFGGVPGEQLQAESVLTYRTLTDNRRIGRASHHKEAYEALKGLVGGSKAMSHSRHILDYVQGKDYSPSLLDGGCLYLPDNAAWTEFYSFVGHPYPPLFAEMIAHSFYPECNNVSSLGGQTALRAECPEGHVRTSERCAEARHAGQVEYSDVKVQVYEVGGHVGMPSKWRSHIELVKRSNRSRRSMPEHGMPRDKCSKSWLLPEVPAGRKLVVPTQYIVCHSAPFHQGIDRQMLKEQAAWMTDAYRGLSLWDKKPFDGNEEPAQVDMQIEFDLVKENCVPSKLDDCYRIRFVQDENCAKYAFSNRAFPAKHNEWDPAGLFTVVFVADDQSGILGMAEFPTDTLEGSSELLVTVSTTGLRKFASKNKKLKLDTSYDEGDTAVHEGGHALGLFHTFQGGCALDGDQIADTHAEAFPTYTCSQGNSCGKTDPVHNFMDYTPDSCMNGFTELQKRRVWCIFETYRPKLFRKSLRASRPLADDELPGTQASATKAEVDDAQANHHGVNVTVHFQDKHAADAPR